MDYLNLENLKLLNSHLKIIDLRHPNEASSLGINQTNIEVLSIPYYLLKTNLSNLNKETHYALYCNCLLYTSPSPRDRTRSRMPSSA